MIFDFDLVKIGGFVFDMVFFCVLCATLPLMVDILFDDIKNML